jgi:hypothetical protein
MAVRSGSAKKTQTQKAPTPLQPGLFLLTPIQASYVAQFNAFLRKLPVTISIAGNKKFCFDRHPCS